MAEEKEKKSTKNTGLGFRGSMLLVVLLLLGLAFLPTSLLLFVGMLPSVVAFFFRTPYSVRASTIVAMNLAGCIPFVFKLWSSSNDFEASVRIITDLNYLSVMYMAAAFGYMIDWVVTGIVSSYQYQKGLRRMKMIKKRQKFLIDQWGRGVAGAHVEDEEVE